MPVLHVPAGEEGGPGGFPNLLKEEEKEKDEDKKKEDDNDEEEMGERRGMRRICMTDWWGRKA